jgi:hypothetical protein
MSRQSRCWTVKHPRNHHHKDWTAASTSAGCRHGCFVPPIIKTTVSFCTYLSSSLLSGHLCQDTGRGANRQRGDTVPAMMSTWARFFADG